jgi:hypothetical protein
LGDATTEMLKFVRLGFPFLARSLLKAQVEEFPFGRNDFLGEFFITESACITNFG